MAVLLSGCSQDVGDSPSSESDYGLVEFKVALSCASADGTRSLAPGYKFSDGKSISVLRAYVYNQAYGIGVEPTSVKDIVIENVGDNLGGSVSLLLPKGEKYDVIFLATSIPQCDESSKLYFSPIDRTLTFDYSKSYCNDEELDCFWTSLKGISVGDTPDDVIYLTRPLAQVNIGTMDYDAYNATTPVKDIAVSVSGVYSSFSLMDGSVIGDPMTAKFKASPIPSGQNFAKDGYTHLSMNYVLVNLRKLVDVNMTVNHADSSVDPLSLSYPNVAVERNYQSNIHGKELLTNPITI